MEWRHRPRQDDTSARRQATTLDKLVAFTEARHELRNLAEIIAVVGIAHYDVAAGRLGKARHQGVAVTPLRHRHHPGPVPPGDLGGAVGTAVVGHDDLAADPRSIKRTAGLLNDRREGVRFV